MFTEGNNALSSQFTSTARNRELLEGYPEQSGHNSSNVPTFLTNNKTKLEMEGLKGLENCITAEGTSASGPAQEPPKMIQRKRKRKVYRVVRVSCVNCRQSKQACDEFRPCARCIRLGLEEMCVDAPSSRPRPLSSHIPTPNDKLFPKVHIHKEFDRLSSAGSKQPFVDGGKFNISASEKSNTVEISRLLFPFLSNVEQLKDSFLSRYYSDEGRQFGSEYKEFSSMFETGNLEDTVLEAVTDLSKMMILWDKDLQTRLRQSNKKEELEDIAKSHALFSYVLKVLKKFLELWGVEAFSEGGKRVLDILGALQELSCAKPENASRMRSFLPVRKVKLTADQQHEFLANIPMACLKMSLRVNDSFHTVDFANKEACDLFSASEEDLSILIQCRETLPLIMGGVDWIRKPMFLLRLLTENTLKRVEVYHLVTFDGSLYKCNVSCSVILGDDWEPDSYIFFLQNAERLGQDPLAGAFLHRVVSHVKSRREQNSMRQVMSVTHSGQEPFRSENMPREYCSFPSTVMHM